MPKEKPEPSETLPPVRPAATWPFPQPLSKPVEESDAAQDEKNAAPTESLTRREPT